MLGKHWFIQVLWGLFVLGSFFCVTVLGEAEIRVFCDRLDVVIPMCRSSAHFLQVKYASTGFDVSLYTLGLFVAGTCC